MAIPPVRRFKPKVTRAEKLLCAELRKEGIPFQPQVKIKTKSGRTYLVDILVNEKIVVEVGYVGLTDIQEHEDLRESGYTVLHFRSQEIMRNLKKGNIKKIVEAIRKTMEAQKRP